MSSQGDDDSPDHPDVAPSRSAFQVNARAGAHGAAAGIPASRYSSSAPPAARGAGAWNLSGSAAGGHYADSSRTQPEIPEELLPAVEDEAAPLFREGQPAKKSARF